MTYATDTSHKPRLLALDLARGLAAIVVALYHLQGIGWMRFNNGAPVFAVPFFFILSGYVLSYSYGGLIRDGHMGLGDFAAVRFARLYPLHVASMGLMALLWLTLGALPPPEPGPQYPLVASHFGLLQLVEGVTLTHALFGGANGFNSPSWSISIEVWCGFAILALFAAGAGLRLAVAGAVAAAVIASTPGRFHLLAWPPRAYIVGAGLFVLGYVLHAARPLIRPLVRRLPDRAWWALAGATLLAILLPPWPSGGTQPVFYLVFALLIAVLAEVEVAGKGARAMMSRAGDWSYGIYLWHFPLLCVLAWADGWTRARLGWRVLGHPAGDVLFVVLLLAIAGAGYRQLELPAKAWLRRSRRQLQRV